MKIVIGTRGSKLALAQAHFVEMRLKEVYPEDEIDIHIIKTKGDLIQDKPLNQIGDKGLFTTEIEKSLLSGEITMAVHSMKDMPGELPEGLAFTKCWKREDARDVLILREKQSLSDLKKGAKIGTGSVRRQRQLLALRPDLKIVDIRGNIDTRLKKMNQEKLDGIVLAKAGLNRLSISEENMQSFTLSEMIPAPAQGVLALEINRDNDQLREKLDALSDSESDETASAERYFLAKLGGDCHLPVGAFCEKSEQGYVFHGVYGRRREDKVYRVKEKSDTAMEAAKSALKALRKEMAGTVSLVGAGPGDPGLITLRGQQKIKEADCLIYDRLIPLQLLEETKADCEKIYVGKRNHHHTMPQDRINQLLAAKAMEYQSVVRLKGGDNYVFGRGGEEACYLVDHQIKVEVVPGISSILAGPAYAGIPITHRKIASGFHVVTAHNEKDELAEIDFASMARGRETCLFLMGLNKLPEIMQKLQTVGMPSDTKVAVISKATTPQQRTCTGTISTIVEQCKKDEIVAPALIVVGEVVSLREKLAFFENGKLFGKKYLLPKIGKTPSRLGKLIREQGAFVDEVTVGQINFIEEPFAKEELEAIQLLSFSSKNAVHGFFSNLAKLSLDTRALSGKVILAMGTETARLLQTYGIKADGIPTPHNRVEMEKLIQKYSFADNAIWRVGPKREEIGYLDIYTNDAVDFTIQDIDCYDGIIFTCASNVERICEHTVPASNCQMFSIGKRTSKAIIENGFSTFYEAEEATYEGIRNLMINI